MCECVNVCAVVNNIVSGRVALSVANTVNNMVSGRVALSVANTVKYGTVRYSTCMHDACLPALVIVFCPPADIADWRKLVACSVVKCACSE